MIRCLETCCSLPSWNNTKPFLHGIVTCYEKESLFNNCIRSAKRLDKDEFLKHTSKLEFHQKKLMVLVFWSLAGVIHYSFMRPGSNFKFCSHRIVIYIFSTDQKSKIFSLLIKILLLSFWSDQEVLYVSCHGKAFFLATF